MLQLSCHTTSFSFNDSRCQSSVRPIFVFVDEACTVRRDGGNWCFSFKTAGYATWSICDLLCSKTAVASMKEVIGTLSVVRFRLRKHDNVSVISHTPEFSHPLHGLAVSAQARLSVKQTRETRNRFPDQPPTEMRQS